MTRLELGGYGGAGILAALAIIAVLTPVGVGGEKSIVGPVRPAKGAIVALDPERQTEIERLARSFVISGQIAADLQAATDRPPKVVALVQVGGRRLAYIEAGGVVRRLAVGQEHNGWRLVGTSGNTATFRSGERRVGVRLFTPDREEPQAQVANETPSPSTPSQPSNETPPPR